MLSNEVKIIMSAEDRASGVLSGISGALSKLGTIALAAVGAGGLAFGKFLLDSVSEAANAELAIADLNAVIASTNGVAGITATAAQELASSLQSVTRFSDETIMKAEGMLLTFTKIGKDIFPLATETVLNMAEKMGGADTAAIQLGKALNDPIEGVGALRRVGVQFTDEQEKLIESLVASGKIEEAQKIILQELQTEFGGVARAAGNTAVGLKDRFLNTLSDVKETVGNAILPSLVELGNTLMTTFSDPKVQEFISVFAQRLAEISMLSLEWLMDLPNKIKELGDAVANSPFGSFLEFMGLWWLANGESIKNTASALFDSLSNAVARASEALAPFIKEILAKLMLWFAENGPLITSYIATIASAFALLIDAVVLVWKAIQPVLSSLLTLILDIGKLVMQMVTGDWSGAWDTLKIIASDAFDAIVIALGSFFSLILQLLGSNVSEFTKVWSDNWNQLVLIVVQVKDIIFSKLGEWKGIGVKIIENLIDGIKSAVGGLISAASGAVSAALGAASSLLGGGSSGSTKKKGGSRERTYDFASGTNGVLQVPSGFPNDSYPIRLSSGENFAVWNKNQSIGMGGGVTLQVVYAPGISFGDESEAEQRMWPTVLKLMQQAKANGQI